MKIDLTLPELTEILSRAIGVSVKSAEYSNEAGEEKVTLTLDLSFFEIMRVQNIAPPPAKQPEQVPLRTDPNNVPASEVNALVFQSGELEGVVYEYDEEGEVRTRVRTQDEQSLPPGEPIVYVKGKAGR